MPQPDPFIIGFSGRAGAGKDTAADYLAERYGFQRFAFADALRAMLFSLLDHMHIDPAWLTEPALKESVIPGLGASYRQLAQTLGTEWGRRELGDDFWLRVADMHLGLQPYAGGLTAPLHDRIVITDVRFHNEVQWVRQRGGCVIGINRSTPAVRPHISEQLIESLEVWTSINNDGPLDNLHRKLDRLAELMNLGQRQITFITTSGCADAVSDPTGDRRYFPVEV